MVKLFKYAIGRPLRLIKTNPMTDLDMSAFKMEVRKKLPTHEQIGLIRAAGMLSVPRKDTGAVHETMSGPMFACLIDMAYLCWQRAGDVRTLMESQIADGYIRFVPSKTAKSSGKVVDVMVTPAMNKVLDSARAIKQEAGIESVYLFPTQRGTPYTKSGLNSMWTRSRARAGITDDIWFRDLRALAATDAAESNVSTADLQARLAHTDSATSKKYIKRVVADVSDLDSKLPW